jgi:hypothetical protein
VENDSGVIIHLVKLIDAADTLVTQNEGSGLQNDFTSLRVLGN